MTKFLHVILLLSPTITWTLSPLRVAILGSGISGSAAARHLADEGVSVTVFEMGKSVGGRMSTRIMPYGTKIYNFDHGCQYISKPKTEIFNAALNRWKDMGVVKSWDTGMFATTTLDGSVVIEDKKERWVGYPRMSSIPHYLLDHKNIEVKLQTHAKLERVASRWQLVQEDGEASSGTFDWLVCTDRMSISRDIFLDDFGKDIDKIETIKSLTAMVVFESPLDLSLDGIQFNDEGLLGWAARDTSKPGRSREDTHECWVLQSSPKAAKEILQEANTENLNEIRELACASLVSAFLKRIPSVRKVSKPVPAVVTAIGHRWGAAFPISSSHFVDMDFKVIEAKQFVACGDYFSSMTGRIEGAYTSGRLSAEAILKVLDI